MFVFKFLVHASPILPVVSVNAALFSFSVPALHTQKSLDTKLHVASLAVCGQLLVRGS